jgi:hypothetical protein
MAGDSCVERYTVILGGPVSAVDGSGSIAVFGEQAFRSSSTVKGIH